MTFPVPDTPEILAIKEQVAYNGIPDLKPANVNLPITDEQRDEILKVRDDVIYFCNNYVRVGTVDGDISLLKTHEYQEEFIKAMYENRFVIGMMARQMGKCVTGDTFIKVRNRKTNETLEMPIQKFMEMVS